MAAGKYEQNVKPYLDKVEVWARKGAELKEIAKKLGVGEATLRRYRKDHPELEEAFQRGAEEPNEEVEAALYRRATGYNATETKHYKLRSTGYDGQGRKVEREELVEVQETVHVPADVRAQIFWLVNREPERWKNKPEEAPAGDEEGKSGLVELPAVMEPPPEEGEDG